MEFWMRRMFFSIRRPTAPTSPLALNRCRRSGRLRGLCCPSGSACVSKPLYGADVPRTNEPADRSLKDVSCYPAPSKANFNHRQSLLVSGRFPVPKTREHAGRSPEKRPDHGSRLTGVARFRCISLHFPCKSGNCARDEFATDCTLRHSVCSCRDFASSSKNRLRNSRDSAMPDNKRLWQAGLRPPNGAHLQTLEFSTVCRCPLPRLGVKGSVDYKNSGSGKRTA
jgi:hypothetical protein